MQETDDYGLTEREDPMLGTVQVCDDPRCAFVNPADAEACRQCNVEPTASDGPDPEAVFRRRRRKREKRARQDEARAEERRLGLRRGR